MTMKFEVYYRITDEKIRPIAVYGKVFLMEAVKQRFTHLLEAQKDFRIPEGTVVQLIEKDEKLPMGTFYIPKMNMCYLDEFMDYEELTFNPFCNQIWNDVNET